MSLLSRPIVLSTRIQRAAPLAALLGAFMLAGPAAPALAQSTTQMHAGQVPAESPEQAVGQRITTLHRELKITPAEEQDWQGVAQTMRTNVANMQKLAGETSSQSRQGMTAIEDLQTYQKFAQAHLDGLKNLISAFQSLYDKMPPPQQKLADQVFQNAHRQEAGRPS